MKRCARCGVEKPLDEFHNKVESKDGKQSQCKLCNNKRVKEWQAANPKRHRENWKRHTLNRNSLVRKAREYNIDFEELQTLVNNANGFCEICKREPIKWLVVDHCHDTMLVRGILCERCNQALGLFADNPEYLENAIKYLSKEPLVYSPYKKLPRQKYK